MEKGPHDVPARAWLFLLWIVSGIYHLSLRIRALAYSGGMLRRRRLPVPVVSVGNLSLGGTGKTPLVEKIARVFSGQRIRVAILSRGYQGRYERGTLIVSDGVRLLAGPGEAGDEAYMLAKDLPSVAVIVGKDRFRSGMRAIRDLGAQLLVLDDGFQHLPLRRDVDLVLLDAVEPFGCQHLFPRGLLREPLGALSRADAFIVMEGAGESRLREIRESVRAYNREAPLFVGQRRPLHLVALPEESRQDLAEIRGRRCVAFCGIANPNSFLSLLSALEAEVRGSLSFPDHHPYTRRELEEVAAGARSAGAELLVTTEKDAVRLPSGLFPLPIPLLYLRMEIQLQDDRGFFSFLQERSSLPMKGRAEVRKGVPGGRA
jgi:tetraacyldisaccharide 4'-kinase